MTFSVIIPARYASTRLPAKALADIGGKPMVQRVYECALSSQARAVYVATDDDRICKAMAEIQVEALMTSPDHASGTDRLAEVVNQLAMADDEILVNVQGDEPLMPAAVINQVAQNLGANPDCVCATLSEPIQRLTDFQNPSVVKVVSDEHGHALYFSRAPIPWPRDAMPALPETIPAQRHIGIYAYRAGFLREFVKHPAAAIERIESLEQLRILAMGAHIHVEPSCAPVPGGVDTQEDLAAVRALFETSQNV